ncbi:MAG TPA: Rieske 2Fe-2S domain-containing protein [Caulobacteraceae bacterium]|jgi:phenylpropionate dioxygenase-like ring-hydroxylating dioxygenase large terminal subunit
MADDAGAVVLSSPVAVAAALANMTKEERARWRTADVPGRPSVTDRNLDIPFPYGWFPALLSDELAVAEVRPLRYFGRDLVIWRGEDGVPRMLDAHCRHLGAHMGHGGRVAGPLLECPFHAWRYDGEGVVHEIPYAQTIPPRLRRPCKHQWPVTEANRMIWFWHHPDGVAPEWEVEVFPEATDPEWTDYDIHEWRVFGSLQNMAENAVDVAHFRFVHGTATFPTSEMIWDGVRRASIIDAGLDTPQGRVEARITARMIGPGQNATRFTGIAETLLIAAVTPVEKDEVRVRFCFTQPRGQTEGMSAMVAHGFIQEVCRQLDQDKVIWDRQRYLRRPIICDGDGPILQFRRYYRQFYAGQAAGGSAPN